MDLSLIVTLMAVVGFIVSASFILWALCFAYRRLIAERSLLSHEGRVVVITGTDSGFGRETAVRLVKRGATVLAGCFLQESLTSLKDEVGPQAADRMVTLPLNLLDDDSTDRFVKTVRAYLHNNGKRLHGFLNNAGLFAAAPSEWMTRDDIRRIFAVNTISAMELSNKMAPLLQQGGRMVSISSVSAVVHGGQLSVYGASKAALDHFHSAMRVESERGFSVHLIMPGGFRTPLLNPTSLRANLANIWNRVPEAIRNDYGEEFYATFSTNWAEGVVHYANSKPSWVVDNVEHALFAEHPRDRYYTGWDAIGLFGPLSFLPTFVQDRILKAANSRFFQSANGKVRMNIHNPAYAPIEYIPEAA